MDSGQVVMSMEEWARDKPLSILQLDPADRAVLRIADERDAIQKKTFTKWVNKHLTKCGKRVADLFEDLRDGHNLVSLVEVLSGEHLPRERGRMRFHMLQNVENVLRFLRYRKIKLVNIRAEDIVDGNPKLTLGLIWTIILHFQISDIVVGMEENVSAKDVLLRWAQKTTAKYPGVRVDNFTTSWRDGLAFNAIIHRNRPDLIDWRSVQKRSARDRLETAFSVAERDCGVTRLLDAEDVDTPQPDEKSLITYISSLYDAFPEPPRLHPLYDTDSQKKWEEYREIAASLLSWTRHNSASMQERHFPSSLIDLRRMAADMNKFRVEEVPRRMNEKQRMAHIFRDVERHFRDNDMDRELHIDNIDRQWQTMMLNHQEKDQLIHEEIKKLEKLQRVAEKLHRDAKHVEMKLDEVEQRIEEEARRIDRLHPLDAKHNSDQIERELHLLEDTIKSMFSDVNALRDARFQQAPELNKMVQHLHNRWINVRGHLHNRLQSVLASISFPIEERTVTRMSKTVLETRLVETNQHFRFVQECSDWIKAKQKRMLDADYGSDLPSVQAELEKQLQEHKAVDKFQSSIERCSSAKNSFHGEELQLYIQYLNNVQKSYTDLLMSSKKRQSDLETLMDFVQSATNELIWLSEKEEREITRDWSSKNLNLVEVEQYYESLMSELERREIQFNAVQDRGESLVLQHHPASKCIETYMSAMQTQWAWLLQLTLCLETHLKHVATYQQFFSDIRECEQQLARKEDLLNSVFSKSEFGLDEGEVLLKDMQDMRDELTKYGDFIQGLTNQSRDIIPLKQRKTNVSRPITVTAICNYKQNNQQMTVSKDERCTLQDNSQRVRWRVSNSSGLEGMVPGVCFLIPPPDKESLDAVDRIRRQYDRSVSLWQKKQLKMRQNMIFATIKVVKSWDLTQFLAMGAEQRNAIRRALNEDADKLIQEGDPTDPALRRLRREIDEVNRLFDEFERRALDNEKAKHANKSLAEQVQSLQTDLDEYERMLTIRVNAPIPRDTDSVLRMLSEHREFERTVQVVETRVRSVQREFNSLSQKSATLQAKVERITEKWETVVSMSSVYVERLKAVEVVLNNLEETSNNVSTMELKLTSHDSIPKDEESIKRISDELFGFQNTLQSHQSSVDRLIEDTRTVRHLVERSRPSSKRNPDVDRLEEDVNRTTSRWSNVCTEVVERVKSSSTSYNFASNYNTSYRNEMNWLETVDSKTRSLPLVEGGGAKRKVNPHMTLYNSVIEEKITIEQVNTMGARLAKEAKQYDINLDKYRLSLEEIHPSIDASLVKKAKVQSTEEAVKLELDQMNLKYQLVADTLYERIQQLSKTAKQEDPTFDVSPVPAPSRLRTYRMHLSLSDSADPSMDLDSHDGDTIDYVQQKSTAKVSLTPATVPAPKKLSITPIKNGNHLPEDDLDIQNANSKPPISSLHFAQIRSAKRVQRVEEGISTETATQIPVVIDPQTGEALTLAQAIGCGLIDVKTGSFVDPRTGQRLTLQEAAEQGFIDPGIVHRLMGLCGLVDPSTGKELTLLDAIKMGWYDLSKGGNFIDPQTGSPISPEQAIRLGIATREKVSPQPAELVNAPSTLSSTVRTSSLATVTSTSTTSPITSSVSCTVPSSSTSSCTPCLSDVVESASPLKSSSFVVSVIEENSPCGSSNMSSSTSKTHGGDRQVRLSSSEIKLSSRDGNIVGIQFSGKDPTLSEMLDQDLVTINTSALAPEPAIWVVDKFSATSLPLSEAASGTGVLDTETAEVYHPAKCSRVTIKYAVENNLIDECTGMWDSQMAISEARQRNIITKPLSLRDCHTMGLLISEGTGNDDRKEAKGSEVLEPATNDQFSIPAGLTHGLLDGGSKTILDTATGEFISLTSALKHGIITSEGAFSDRSSETVITLPEAAEKGYLSSVRRVSIFELPCVIDSEKQHLSTIYEAARSGVINVGERSIKDGSQELSFDNPKAKEAFLPPVGEVLLQPSGLVKPVGEGAKKHEEISVLEAIVNQLILPTGEVLDPESKLYCPLNTAIANESLEATKGELLKSLFRVDVNFSTGVDGKGGNSLYPGQKLSLPACFSIPDMQDVVAGGLTKLQQVPKKKEEDMRDQVYETIYSQTRVKEEEEQVSAAASTGQQVDVEGRSSVEEQTVCGGEGADEKKGASSGKPSDSLRNVPNLPAQGWRLGDAIEDGLMDPVQGLLTIPGTDRLVSLEECVDLKLIDDESGLVSEPVSKDGRRVCLSKALEKQWLDATGHYDSGSQVVCLKDAIDQDYVTLVDEEQRIHEDDDQQELSSGDKVIVHGRSSSSSSSVERGALGSIMEDLTAGEPDEVWLGENLTYDPKVGEVEDVTTGSRTDLFTAVLDGKVKPTLVKLKDPSTGRTMNITEAMRKGKINKKTGRVAIAPGREISFKEALAFGVLSVLAKPSDAISSFLSSSREETPVRSPQPSSRDVTPQTSFDRGSSEEPIVIVTEEIIPYESVVTSTTTITTTTVITTKISRVRVDPTSLVDAGLVDSATAKKLSSKENFTGPKGEALTLKDALELGKIDGDSGAILELQTQQLLTINEALTKNVIDNDGKFLLPVARSLSVPELKGQGLFDPVEEKVIHPETGSSLTISEAIASEVLNPLSPVRDPVTNVNVALSSAVEQRLVCDNTGRILGSKGEVSLLDAVDSGAYEGCKHILEGSVPPIAITLPAAKKRGMFNEETQMLVNPITKEEVSLDRAIEQGLLATEDRTRKPKADATEVGGEQEPPKATAVAKVELKKVAVEQPAPKTTKRIESKHEEEEEETGGLSALQMVGGAIAAAGVGLYQMATSKSDKDREEKPSGGISVKFDKPHLVTPAKVPGVREEATQVVNEQHQEREVPQPPPLDVHIVAKSTPKTEQEVAKKEEETSTAIEFLLPSSAPNPATIETPNFSVRDPRTGVVLDYGEAVQAGLFLESRQAFFDPISGAELSMDAAATSGLAIPKDQSLSIPEIVYSRRYDPVTTLVTIEVGHEVPLKQALEEGIITDKGCVVKHFGTEKIIPFGEAVEEKLVDMDTGSLQTGEFAHVKLDEALDSGWMIEAVTPMSLSEMVLKGLYNPSTGLSVDPATGEEVKFGEAVKRRIVDGESAHVKDTKSGFAKKMSLDRAIEEKYVSEEDGSVRDYRTDTVVPLVDAMDQELVVDSRKPLSLPKAIHSGLFSEVSGRLTDPNTGTSISLNESMRRLVVNPYLPTVYQKEAKVLLSLVEACREGIIDRQQGAFVSQPATGPSEKIPLSEALKTGRIIDTEASYSLYDAITHGLYTAEGKIVQPATGKKVTVADAIKRGVVDPESSAIIKASNMKIVKLKEAIDGGLVDAEGGMYCDVGGKMALDKAQDEGLVLTPERPVTVVGAVEKKLFHPGRGKFADPVICDWVSSSRAIQTKLIDATTSVVQNLRTGKVKSFNAAVEDEQVTTKGTVLDPANGKWLPLDEAVRKNVVTTMDKPVSFEEAMDQEYIDVKRGTFFDPRTSITSPLEEAVQNELIENGSAVVRDPDTDKFRNLREACKVGLVDLKRRALVDPTTRKLKPLCIIFEQGSLIYLRESISFDVARDRGLIDEEKALFCDPNEDGQMTIKEAIEINAIDPTSVVVKDTLKKKLMQFPDAYAKAMLDSESGAVLNTAANHSVPFKAAIEDKLILTPRHIFGLIEALDYSMYDASSGRFVNPFGGKNAAEMTLTECIDKRLIDPHTTVVKVKEQGVIVPLADAIEAGLVDPVQGLFVDPVTNVRQNLVDAWKNGVLVPAEARLAIEAQYRNCDNTITNLMEWLQDIERRLASQETVKETVEELKRQLHTVKNIRDEVEDHSQSVYSCLDQVRDLVTRGGDVLSSEEITSIERNGKTLKSRYENVSTHSEQLLRKLTIASDEFKKYKNEVTIFKTWMDKAVRVLEEKERNISNIATSGRDNTKEFVSDVIAHQGDLRFITMSASKFIDESRDYLQTLNEFRTNLPQRLPFLEARESVVRHEVTQITTTYQDLFERANRLLERLSSLGNKQKDFQDALNKALAWLKEIQPRVQKLISEPVAGEPRQIEDQLARAKALQNEVLSNGRIIENVRHASINLLNSMEGLSPAERSQVERAANDLESKYQNLLDVLKERVSDLDAALIQSQNMQDAVDSVANWLTSAENQLRAIFKPASLIRERLDEQIREVKMLQADIDSHRPSIESMARSADDLLKSGSSRVSKKVESKLKDVLSRYEKLVEKLVHRAVFLNEVSTALDSFTFSATSLEQWFQDMFEIIETKLVGENAAALLDSVMQQKEARRREFEETVSSGKDLVNKKDVTDTGPAKDRIRGLENMWKELNASLDEKAKLNRQRAEYLNSYERLRDQVLSWLGTMEGRVNNLQPVAVDMEIIKNQTTEVQQLTKEHRDYSSTIDKVNELGAAYENICRGDRAESPRRRIASSPTKRTSFRPSEPRSPSPSKTFNGQSPLSPSGSSGFGSRRPSDEGFMNIEDSSPVQQQLNEINHRYNLIGMKLSDRQSELEATREEVRKISESLKTLSAFLDKTERNLPKHSVPHTKEEVDKIHRQIKNILDDLYDKQGMLDSTRQQIADLLRRKPNAAGAENLSEDFETIQQRWKNLQESCKKRLSFLDNLKEFHDAHDNLNNWLSAKEKMMSVLGPIATDPRVVQNQMQQVQVIRDEFRAMKPTLDSFNNAGDSLLSVTDPNSPDGRKIEDKLANINQKWNDLLHQLDERQGNLDAASGASQDFFNKLNKLQDNLHKISDDLDDLITEKGDPDEMMKKLNAIAKHLDSQRPVLADVKTSGEQLCDILEDPAAKADIRQKLGQVDRLFNQCQKKLDNVRADLENSKRDILEFNEDCEAAMDWLNDLLSGLTDKLLVSADRGILKRQMDEFEPTYREVMSKEHEIIMTVNKGKELISKSQRANDKRLLQQNIEKIQKSWDKLKKESVDRHTRLQTCMEHCRKYDRAREAFLQWLTQAEDKFEKFKVVSFKKADIDKQIKELNAFKNELWRHSGEYDTTRSLGETFLAACDIDKDGVKRELQDMKDRWEALQNAVLRKAQELEDASAKLAEFNDSVREVKNALNRCEDKLASHDAMGDASKDPKFLQRIKALADEARKLEKPVDNVRQQGENLCLQARANNCDDQHIRDDVNDVMDRFGNLMDKLDDRTSDLEAAQRAMGQFADRLKVLISDVNALEDEFSSFKPVGRDIPTVKTQIRELEAFSDKLRNKRDELDQTAAAAEKLIQQGFATDAKGLRSQIDSVRRQVTKLEDKVKTRDEDLAKTLRKLESFYDLYGATDEDINDLVAQERAFSKNLGGDVDSIRAQQAEFKEFKARQVEAVGKRVDEVNKSGNELIQTANSGVNTTGLEKDLEKLNDKWNALKQRISEHERKLDSALLQSGKFQEALEGLNKWLSDIEEMVANQKPPAADYKVVKAQLQEQKFLNKMLADRKPAVESLFKMGREIAANAEPAERAQIEGQMRSLGDRYDNLCDGAKERTRALEDAMQVAKEFQDKLGPLQDWLEKTGKKLKDMSLIPTDEDKITRRIKEHDALHDNILKKQPEFNDLANVASILMGLVGDDDAAMVADKLQDVTDRYGQLVDDSEALRQLLRQAKADLRHLVLSYEDLCKWMDDMDRRLNKYKVVSVHREKLLEQIDQLANLGEEIKDHERRVDETVEAGIDLMKNISNDEAIQLKDKLDSLQRRFNDVTTKAADLLKNAQEALPLVTQFHECHNNLSDWMTDAEGLLQSLDSANLATQEKEINRLEAEIAEQRKVLDMINLVGPQLCQLSPGEGASTIEGLVTRDNRRFDAICEQVQRRAERIQMAKARSMEVISDIDDLLDWFREIEGQLKDAEKPSCEPEIVRVQLQEHRTLNDEINSQKGRVRDVLATAKKVLREASPGEDTAMLREKAEDLKETMEAVSKLSSDRLNALEQAMALAEHFFQTHYDLNNWMDALEDEMQILETPAIRPDQIMKLLDRLQSFNDAVNQNKPLLDRLNKTGGALVKLCNDEDSARVQDIVNADNDRYNALKAHLREKQQALDKALQDTSRFKDKLDGMLNALESTAEQVKNAEAISAHPEKIRDQIADNNAIIDDMKKREDAYHAVKNTAADVIAKAPNKNDPAVKDIKNKLDRLNSLWDQIQKATKQRGKNLDEALALAEKFWDQLHAVMEKLENLQDTLRTQEPPAVEPQAIQKQQDTLKDIKRDIDRTKPEVVQCRQTGQSLMKVCGDQDKPEIKKNIDDMDAAWDNITALFAKREENLIDAMEKAMEFHDTLQSILKFLDRAEERLATMGGIGTDIDAVKRQIKELKDFKNDVDPMMVKIEALNRQANELTERTSPDQAAKIKGPLAKVNRRWDDLLKGIVDRQRELENALLRLGQFQHALQELMAWIEKTNKSLDTLKPVYGDPQVIEVELAKLKVLMNDIQAHQSSVDTLNDAGRRIIESEKGSDNASSTQRKLNELNKKWDELQSKANSKHKELEDALREAHLFNQEIQDLLIWLNEVDAAISSSKPTGGLPETAAEQLARFMEIYNELEANRPKVEAVLHQGQEYLKKSTEGAATNLQHNLRTLRQRWETVMNRANDKKIKLEIALKEAQEFHKAVQDFVDWLTEAERYLGGLEPVSRVLSKVTEQIESHKEFQKEVSSHREVMLTLEKKGNHLKYFSQKQDVILIKNLLISVQHRWDRVVSKSNERTRALDLGLKESKEFHDAWSSLCKWLDDAEANLDEMANTAGNNPIKIKQMLAKHKEFQKQLAAKQPFYDNTMRMGKGLKDKAPKADEPILRQMLQDLKNKWNSVCNKSIDRQRALEEALLRSGQFKDALQELMDWLKSIDNLIVDDGPVHGDLDTVLGLIEKHKKIEDELRSRQRQLDDLVRTAEAMMETASPEERERLRENVREVKEYFQKIKNKVETRSRRLEEALKEAEKLHKSVHMLLEWLSDAEMKLRFSGSLPEDEATTRKLLDEQEQFMRELMVKEREKDETIDLAKAILAKAHPDAVPVIKHWISIIQSRWDEIASWAKQRGDKLKAHLASLRDLEDLLEELMNWLRRCEDTLVQREAEPLPDDLGELQGLITEHKEFMESMAKRQPEIDSVCKPKLITRAPIPKGKPGSRLRSMTPGDREASPEIDFAQRRISSPGREKSPELFPHIGPRFDRRGSKAIEPQIKNPKVKALWDKWKHVWMLAWERQRRLQDKYNYLLELEKVKNFNWEEWRKRFLKYMNHKKSRVMDLFRKIDKNNNGLIPREDFIDAIMRTKFPTSRLEMNAVADMFDHDGLVDYMEFIAALRADWAERKPAAEADIVDDEIQRQVMQCTCRQRFKVFQVGEGKYRFGDSQKLRLVRILRSTVMVRVGGGWVALDEFLVKNDPCRAKGRTNIELREQFILADGVSQTMTAFKSKTSGVSRGSTPMSSQGPITKIKEKSIRSVPMGSRARSTDRTTPESTFSDDGFGYSRVQRKPGMAGRGSTPGSRSGSKPPSRAGSNASLDSADLYESRIPIRRSGSLKRGSAGTTPGLRTPLGSSTPVSRPPFSLNTNVNGPNPPGLTGRALSFTRPSSAQSAAKKMQRTGSASSLTSFSNAGGPRSRIPIFTGDSPAGVSSRSRTSSNSSIPVAVSANSTPRARTPSSNVILTPDSSAPKEEGGS